MLCGLLVLLYVVWIDLDYWVLLVYVFVVCIVCC